MGRNYVRKLFVASLAVALLAGCISISNPFLRGTPDYTKLPADALKTLAIEIEQAVQKGNREPGIKDRDGIVVSTEPILQAIRMRAARAELLNQFLDSGFGREDKNGLVKILGSKEYTKATSGKERNRDAMLVLNENRDRWTLYEGIAKESKLRGAVATIQDAFHQARVATMKPGQKYQDAEGNTTTK
jgi:hypothetical protein